MHCVSHNGRFSFFIRGLASTGSGAVRENVRGDTSLQSGVAFVRARVCRRRGEEDVLFRDNHVFPPCSSSVSHDEKWFRGGRTERYERFLH